MGFGLEPRFGFRLVHDFAIAMRDAQCAVRGKRAQSGNHPYPMIAGASLHRGRMDELEPRTDHKDEAASADLARRLARYRRRVEAEGRKRSLHLIDRAIEDA